MELKNKSGVIAYRFMQGNEPQILLTTSRKHERSWVFPVGSVRSGESLEQAAGRECLEETGYHVDIGQQLPTFEVSDGETRKAFTFYLATVTGSTKQWEMDRKRAWLPASKIAAALPAVFRPVAEEAVQRLLKMQADWAGSVLESSHIKEQEGENGK